ncbi:MAG: hypothetical protein QM786_01450 [Breznakibacter sp.]
MKSISIFAIFILCLAPIACNPRSAKPIDDPSEGFDEDKKAIEQLVRNFYKWQEANDTNIGFTPIPDPFDSIYVGLDLNELERGIAILKGSNFFADEFLDNYKRIVQTIDQKLRNGELVWFVGDMPPFGNNTNMWCNCQDYPYDNPWDLIEFKYDRMEPHLATLTWTWGKSEWSKNFKYQIIVKKTDFQWKIAYLEGFDFEGLTQTNN